MVFLEKALGSKFNPLVALGRNGSLGLSGFVNKFNAEAELLDDLVRFSCQSGGSGSFIFFRTIIGQRNRTRYVMRCADMKGETGLKQFA